MITKSLALFASLIVLAAPAVAVTEQLPAKDIPFAYEGVFGTFDRSQLQRGFKVYKEVCVLCHSLRYIAFRNLAESGGPEFSEEQVKALAATYQVRDGPNDTGEMYDRPGIPSDRIPSPFPNDNAARAANGGALPPDLSLITKARAGWTGIIRKLIDGVGGPEYVYSVLTGYGDPPAEAAAEQPEGAYYNPYFVSGHWIKMPPPLSDAQVTFDDGAPNTADAMARDVAAFLAWTAEPKMEERKRLGFKVIIYLAGLALLFYLVKQRVWARVEH
jgi:ubiquinol-cytochrome c reductase cytochrome c1 subunit